MTSKLTREERIQSLYDLKIGKVLNQSDIESIKMLARIALAAMDSEPVAWVMLEDLADKDIVSTPAYPDINDAMEMTHGELEPLYRHAQQPVVPEGLNPETTDLVLRFASALADKLYKAEQKYGRSTDWMKDDWYDDCLQSLWEHIEKGDPRDVAAYCAFMWYHGWVTTDYDRNVQNACRAAMLQSGNSPVIPDGYVMVPKEPTKEMIDAGWLHFMGTKNPSSKGTYKAMLAAAEQEVPDGK
ncbi:hypothetical protein [Klebsiella grimontii]|uniref:hypothetical protein n=1 Tax=Klebsiella grimontii TaxID=2058152 RepID=UPI0022439DC3|nr:hypothetical protein [Klebsiella grimontii]